MGTSDLNATVEIKSGLQREPWTWAQAATLSLDESGFRDPEGLRAPEPSLGSSIFRASPKCC